MKVADAPKPRFVTKAQVLRIALPITLSSAAVPMLRAGDSLIMGQMGLAAPIGVAGIGR
jgi:Na+-driven multidrug efflux pump